MSSTHSDSNSKKVYRQPQESTIQQALEALKKVSQKFEELFEKIHAYDVSYLATNSALEPVQAEMKKTKVELEKVKADLEKVKATGLMELIRKLFPGQQSGTEDSQKSARIGEYEQIIKQKSAQVEEYEQKIEKHTEPFLGLKEQVLMAVDELDQVVDTVLPFTQTWHTAVIDMARNDLLHATITPEDLIYIQDTAPIVTNSTKRFFVIKDVTKYIKVSFTIGIHYSDDRYAPPGQPIGVHYGTTGTTWRYKYGRGDYMYLRSFDYKRDLLGRDDKISRRDFQSDASIRAIISNSIATLQGVAHLFPSSSPNKPDTQTA
jgi:hypothetical protein